MPRDTCDDDGKAVRSFYVDDDGDGYGDALIGEDLCPEDKEVPERSSVEAGDCDDKDRGVNPGASEQCDGVDNDCNGEIDDGLPTIPSWADADGDDYGDPQSPSQDCSLPPGYVENADDCDDDDPLVNPGEAELCDGWDNDCDSEVDEDWPQRVAYVDDDGDGYGDTEASATFADCPPNPPSGFAWVDGDCDDGAADLNPADADGDGASTCDPVPDCDDTAAALNQRDDDQDCVTTCDGDCDDADPTQLGYEICDGVDNDCDGAPEVSRRWEWTGNNESQLGGEYMTVIDDIGGDGLPEVVAMAPFEAGGVGAAYVLRSDDLGPSGSAVTVDDPSVYHVKVVGPGPAGAGPGLYHVSGGWHGGLLAGSSARAVVFTEFKTGPGTLYVLDGAELESAMPGTTLLASDISGPVSGAVIQGKDADEALKAGTVGPWNTTGHMLTTLMRQEIATPGAYLFLNPVFGVGETVTLDSCASAGCIQISGDDQAAGVIDQVVGIDVGPLPGIAVGVSTENTIYVWDSGTLAGAGDQVGLDFAKATLTTSSTGQCDPDYLDGDCIGHYMYYAKLDGQPVLFAGTRMSQETSHNQVYLIELGSHISGNMVIDEPGFTDHLIGIVEAEGVNEKIWVTDIGDLNGDGVVDHVLFSAHEADDEHRTDAGKAYLVPWAELRDQQGDPVSVAEVAVREFAGEEEYLRLMGHALADFDGDGADDVLLGAGGDVRKDNDDGRVIIESCLLPWEALPSCPL